MTVRHQTDQSRLLMIAMTSGLCERSPGHPCKRFDPQNDGQARRQPRPPARLSHEMPPVGLIQRASVLRARAMNPQALPSA